MSLVDYVGTRIRELRTAKGLSQEALAQSIKTTANTISRWETGTYRPTIDDLEKLSRNLGVSILDFFPPEEQPSGNQISALLRAAKDLSTEDLEELRNYAEYRRARHLNKKAKSTKGGRRRKKAE